MEVEKSESKALQSIQELKAVVAKGPANSTRTNRVDKQPESSSGKAVVERSWEVDFKNLIKIYDEMDCPSYIEIYLPFGWSQFKKPQDQFIEFAGVTKHELHELSRFTKNEYMRLYIQNTKGRRRLGLKQTFFQFPDAGHIIKQPGFSYKWTGNKTIIFSTLGTTDIKKIKIQIQKLLNECKRFLFMYCTIEIPKIN